MQPVQSTIQSLGAGRHSAFPERHNCRLGSCSKAASIARKEPFSIDELRADKDIVARNILFSLPEWFGRPESTENYVREVQILSTLPRGSAVVSTLAFLL